MIFPLVSSASGPTQVVITRIGAGFFFWFFFCAVLCAWHFEKNNNEGRHPGPFSWI